MKKYFKQFKANKKGFTLIEMIVVIAIIGILAAVLVPSMGEYVNTAKESKNVANAKIVYTAAQAAVTSLEATTAPVETGIYTKNGETKTVSGDKATNAIADTLFNKIENLIGKTNYSKLYGISVAVANSTVTSVSVSEKKDDTPVKYPEQSQISDAGEES